MNSLGRRSAIRLAAIISRAACLAASMRTRAGWVAFATNRSSTATNRARASLCSDSCTFASRPSGVDSSENRSSIISSVLASMASFIGCASIRARISSSPDENPNSSAATSGSMPFMPIMPRPPVPSFAMSGRRFSGSSSYICRTDSMSSRCAPSILTASPSASVNVPVRRYSIARYSGCRRISSATSSRISLRCFACLACRSRRMRERAFDSHCICRRLALFMSVTADSTASCCICWYAAHSASSMPDCSCVWNIGFISLIAACRLICSSLASMRSMTCRTSPVSNGRSSPNSRR